MKKLLVALFIVLILGIGIVGYTQESADKDNTTDDNSQSLIYHS